MSKFLPGDPVRRVREMNTHESLTSEQIMEEGIIFPNVGRDGIPQHMVHWIQDDFRYIRRGYIDESLTFKAISIA